MKLLLDTLILLWASEESPRLSRAARRLLSDPENELIFSAASIWEIAIKRSLSREDFKVEPRLLRRGLLDNDYVELPISGEHALMVETLPPLHKDPFDRLLLAQAAAVGAKLITSDAVVAQYGGPVELV